MYTSPVQVVQHIELNIEGSGMQYSPGDLLVTLPEVAHSAGTELLQCMGIPAGELHCLLTAPSVRNAEDMLLCW